MVMSYDKLWKLLVDKKTEWIMLIAYIFFYIEFLPKDLNEDFFMVFVKFISQAFIVGFEFLCVYNITFFIRHLVQSLYYLIKGYGMSPILCYPFLILPSEKKKVRPTKNFMYISDFFYSKKLLEQSEYNEEKVSYVCQKANLYGLIFQIIFCIILAVAALWMNQIFLCIGIFIIAYSHFILAMARSSSYHGLLTRNHYMKKGYTAFYLTSQLILYNCNSNILYNRFEECLKKEDAKYFFGIIMETIKHMKMIQCINSKFECTEDMETYIKENIMVKKMSELSDIDTGVGKFDFMKVYMCYSMICEKKESLNLVVYHFESLDQECKINSLSSDKENICTRYVNIGKNYTIKKEKLLFPSRIIPINGFYNKFDNYKTTYFTIIDKMYSLCDYTE